MGLLKHALDKEMCIIKRQPSYRWPPPTNHQFFHTCHLPTQAEMPIQRQRWFKDGVGLGKFTLGSFPIYNRSLSSIGSTLATLDMAARNFALLPRCVRTAKQSSRASSCEVNAVIYVSPQFGQLITGIFSMPSKVSPVP